MEALKVEAVVPGGMVTEAAADEAIVVRGLLLGSAVAGRVGLSTGGDEHRCVAYAVLSDANHPVMLTLPDPGLALQPGESLQVDVASDGPVSGVLYIERRLVV
ncbi:MAG: hypothetical protein M3014_10750 [Chloroflexota bacterium]|nr:hypothetical protein [Chloroflexota bacterium]